MNLKNGLLVILVALSGVFLELVALHVLVFKRIDSIKGNSTYFLKIGNIERIGAFGEICNIMRIGR